MRPTVLVFCPLSLLCKTLISLWAALVVRSFDTS